MADITKSEWLQLKYDVIRLKAIVFGQSIGMAVLAVIVAVTRG